MYPSLQFGGGGPFGSCLLCSGGGPFGSGPLGCRLAFNVRTPAWDAYILAVGPVVGPAVPARRRHSPSVGHNRHHNRVLPRRPTARLDPVWHTAGQPLWAELNYMRVYPDVVMGYFGIESDDEFRGSTLLTAARTRDRPASFRHTKSKPTATTEEKRGSRHRCTSLRPELVA